MVEKYGDTHSSAGWVWAIVGIIVAALIVWWIAAAVSNNEPEAVDYGGQTVGANEDYNAEEPGQVGEAQSDEFAQNAEGDPDPGTLDDNILDGNQGIGGGPVDDNEQPNQDQTGELGMVGDQEMAGDQQANAGAESGAIVSGTDQGTQSDEPQAMEGQQAQGEANSSQPQELQAFNDWNQNLQGDLTPQKIEEGVGHLNEATTGIISLYSETPQAGSQMGGGPDEGISGAVSSERQKFDESIDKLQEAQAGDKAQDFKEAANDFVALLDKIQSEANVSEASQPLAQLRDDISKIDDSQKLSDQQDKVESFFDQSAGVLNTFAQNAPASQSGSTTPSEQSAPTQQPASTPMQNDATQ